MNDYTKGILTGASVILCIFMLGCPNNQSQDLGHIKVKSIKVLNNEGQTSVWISSSVFGGSGIIDIKDDGETKASLGSENGNGIVVTYGSNNKQSTTLGGEPAGVNIFRKTGGLAAALAVLNGDGLAALYDRYGDSGWSASGRR